MAEETSSVPEGGLPPEFHGAPKLALLHRWAVGREQHGLRAYFGLTLEDGTTQYFWADQGTVGGLAFNFSNIMQSADNINGKPVSIAFETTTLIAGLPLGEHHQGHVALTFVTATGATLLTELGPTPVGNLLSTLQEAVKAPSAAIDVPPFPIPGIDTPGKEHTKSTVSHFGQEYNAAILEALGVLTVRANLLENSLVTLLSAVTKMPLQQAKAMFYSTVNMRARNQPFSITF